ncbi:hypothetical protein [Streptomyces sp. G45]|uniref:hypothetical protein n=1 Tax=Streptomyces sp. G45 TaxID=3406627 RepID=UPI003C1859ED
MLAQLSPRQRQFASLLARGPTNREIGERLSPSPRTGSPERHRGFPELGNTARAQHRDLIEDALTS